MTSLCTLPKEIISSILLKLPPSEITSRATLINKQFHTKVTNENFWKELCQVRYYVPSSGLKKPPNHSWQYHAFELEKSHIWIDSNPSLKITNKSYTLSYPPSQTQASPSDSFFVGVASKPMVAGPFIGRYFEIVIDSLPAGDDVLQMVVGLAPHNILLNPTQDKVYGYTNTGKSNTGSCGQPYTTGDRIGVLLNTEFMTVSFLKNDILQGTPYVYLDKNTPFHPVVGFMKAGAQVTIPLPPLKEPPPMPLR
eukprot:Phypoly_transcript_15677.p1 GENE.Phypoly_transcript_15677~~Phypoly_transcript_15677.p1  ORF type:complete len:289 (+),score=44.20 Phypoly_transcript_15677:113-868(+)